MKKTGPDSIKNEFLDIYAAIRDASDDDILNGPDQHLRPFFEKLQYLLTLTIDDQEVEEMLCDHPFNQATQHIARLKKINGLRMEIERAQALIHSPDPWDFLKGFRFYPNYLKLAHMEFMGAELKKGDRVVFLGSGPLPLSLICLCTQHGVQGIGIEQIAEYADLSQNVIHALELGDHIQIMQGNHLSLPLKEACDLVMVGADAIPKDDIFNHLSKVLPKGAKVSYRIYEKGLRRLMDGHPVTHLPPSLKESARIRPEPPVNNTSIFLTIES